MTTAKKIISFPGERWSVIREQKSAYGEKYAISNHGRLVKFIKTFRDGSLLKGSLQEGYPIWRYLKNGKHKHILLHRLVAKYFLSPPLHNQKILIHLNHKKKDNHYKNLKWATQEEVTKHASHNPAVILAKKNMLKNIGSGYNTKLTEAKVKQIKSFLKKGKTLKELAVKYKVSDMQIHRIKTGENWKHVK
jgi:hypothetical protein